MCIWKVYSKVYSTVIKEREQSVLERWGKVIKVKFGYELGRRTYFYLLIVGNTVEQPS